MKILYGIGIVCSVYNGVALMLGINQPNGIMEMLLWLLLAGYLVVNNFLD